MEEKTKKDLKPIKADVKEIEVNQVEQHDLFNVINHNGEFMIALGNQVVTRSKFESREEAIRYIDLKPWELIFNSVAVMITKLQEQS